MERFDPNLNDILLKRRELYGESDIVSVVNPPKEPVLEQVVHKTIAPLIAKRMEFLQDRNGVTGRFLNNVSNDESVELKKSQTSIDTLPKSVNRLNDSCQNEDAIVFKNDLGTEKQDYSISSQHVQTLAPSTPKKSTKSFLYPNSVEKKINTFENGLEKTEAQTLAEFNNTLSTEHDVNKLNAIKDLQHKEKNEERNDSSFETFELPSYGDDDEEYDINDGLERRFTFGGFDYAIRQYFVEEGETEHFFNNDDRLVHTPTTVSNELLTEAKGIDAKDDDVNVDKLNSDKTSCDYVFRTDSVPSDSEMNTESDLSSGALLRRYLGIEQHDLPDEMNRYFSLSRGSYNAHGDVINNPTAFRTPGMYWASRPLETRARPIRLGYSYGVTASALNDPTQWATPPRAAFTVSMINRMIYKNRPTPPPPEPEPVPPRLSRGRRILNFIRNCCGCCFGRFSNRSESD